MEKTAYSAEDIKEILRTLFAEKKKVKELQEKLEHMETEPRSEPSHAQIVTLDDPRLLDRLEALKQRIADCDELQEPFQVFNDCASTYEQQIKDRTKDNEKLKRLVLALKQKCENALKEAKNQSKQATENKAALEAAEQRLAEATTEDPEIQERLAQTETENSELKNHLEETQNTINALEERLKTDLDQLKKELLSEQEMRHSLEATLAESQREAADDNTLKLAVEGLEQEGKRLQKQLESRERALKESEANRARLQQSTQEQQDAIQSLRKELASLQDRIVSQDACTDADVQQIIEEKQELNNELENAKKELDRSNSLLQVSQEQHAQSKQQAEKLVERIGEHEQRIKELEEYELSYAKVSEQKQHTEQCLQSQKNEVRTLKEFQEELKLDLQRQLEKKDEDIQSLTEQLNATQEKLASLDTIQSDLSVSLQKYDAVAERCQALERELVEREAALADERERIQVLEDSRCEVTGTLSEKTAALNAMDREIDVIKQTLVRSVRESKELESRYLETVSEKVSSINYCRQLEADAELRCRENQALTSELEESKRNNRQLETRIEDLHLSIDSSRAHTESLQERINTLEGTCERYESERNQLQQAALTAENFKADAEETLSASRDALAAMTKEKEACEERIQQAELALQIVSQEKRLLVDGNEAATERERLLQEEITRLGDQITECHTREEVLLEAQQQMDEAISQAESALSESNSRHESERQHLIACNQQLEQEAHMGKEYLGQLRDLEEKYDLLRDDYEAAQLRIDEAVEGRQELENTSADLESSLDLKNHALEAQTAALEETQAQLQQLSEDFTQAQAVIADREERIKIAQQHLAKKVKEYTVLNDQQEELKTLQLELNHTITMQATKIDELNTTVESHRQQEKKLQELLNESIKSAESQVGKWEKKYFDSYDKWQESENRNKDLQQEVSSHVQQLKQLEDKHQQVTSLLAKLGTFLGNPFGVSPNQAGQEALNAPTPQELATLAAGMQTLEQAPIMEAVAPAPAPAPKQKLEFGTELPTVEESTENTQAGLFIGDGRQPRGKRNLFD